MQKNIDISILLPTRGRTNQLKKSISSLIDLADHPEKIEWLLGFDEDDSESFEYFQAHIQPIIEASGGEFTAMGFEPLGYTKLNVYVNSLAGLAKGNWFVFWNDDAVMKSQGWDTVINSYTGKFCLQAFNTHKLHPYSIFPIVPREWYDIVGHLSDHQLNDAWMSQIAWLLDIVVRIDVLVEHERYDLTGQNNDVTFKNRIIYEGNPSDPRDFNYVDNRTKRVKEGHKIAAYLRDRGYDLTHWDGIWNNTVNAWDKMLASDINKQLAKPKKIN